MNKNAAGKLEKRIVQLERRIQGEVIKAKEKVKAGQKQKALIHLKRKKMYEKNIESLTNQIFRLETQANALEQTAGQEQVVNAMQATKIGLEHANKKMNADDVQDMQDTLEEAMNEQQEVSQILSQELQMPGLDMDDDTMLGELDDLMGEDDAVNAMNQMNQLPELPSNMPTPSLSDQRPVVDNDEEESLAELEAMMS
eukprot:Stramenopile-MAST_4_protein_1208